MRFTAYSGSRKFPNIWLRSMLSGRLTAGGGQRHLVLRLAVLGRRSWFLASDRGDGSVDSG